MKIGMSIVLVTLTSGALLLSGCGGGGSTGTDSKSGNEETTSTSLKSNDSQAEASHRLVGVWLGVAYIEETKLKAKLDETLDAQAKKNLFDQAQTFQSMLVGAEFVKDGSFTLDAEITPAGGQPARDQSAGNWEITSEVEEMIMVKASEPREDGSFEESFKQYTFVDDDHFVWIPTVSADLQACDAMIVFERQVANNEVAEQPTTESTTR